MNRYNNSGSVIVRARTDRARVTTLRHYYVNMLTHARSRFNQLPLLLGVYGVQSQKILNIMDLTFSNMTMQGLTQRVNIHTQSCSI